MQYLHACYHPDTPDHLFIFGEDTEHQSPKKRGRRPKNPSTTPHTHALSHDRLIETINRYHPLPDCIEKRSVILSLPGRGGKILMSDEPLTGEDIIFIPTEIPALSIQLSHLTHLLPATDTEQYDGIRFRESITFFRYTFGFALECISRQLFIPSFKDEQISSGQWEAVYPPEEQARREQLSRAMPGICYSFQDMNRNPDQIVKTFINSCITAVIREACRNHPLALHGRARSGSNPAARLLMALWGETGPGSAGDGSGTDEAYRSLKKWLSVLDQEGKTRPFFTGIRLLEPSETDTEFRLEYLIQASDDPSLVIPAEEIWKKKTKTITYLHHRFENPQEQILTDLYKAGQIFPPILESLKRRAPAEKILESGMVHQFLADAVPVLKQAGISVLLPSWWKDSSKNPRIRLSLKSGKRRGKSPKGMGFFTRDALLSFDWEISIGDVTLSPDEFEKLVDIKMPLIHIGGKWAAFNPVELKHALATFHRKYPEGRISVMEALRLGLSGGETKGLTVEIAPGDEKAREFFAPLLGSDGQGVMKREAIPAGFKGTLRPYQETGHNWLSFMTGYGLGACLADDMGLGKTIQLIAYLLSGKENGYLHRNLLICPMSLIGNWQRELTRFAPGLSIYIHHGTARAGDETFEEAIRAHDLVLSTYQVISRDLDLMSRHSWDLIVLDEAQNIKNSSTRQAKAVRALSGDRKIALTGTPVENRLSELWSIMEFLNAGYLGGEKAFEQAYSIPIEKYHDTEASERLQSLVRPFILRRVKTDRSIIADLPEKNVMKRYCTLTSEQATLYQAVVEGMLSEVKDAEGIARRGMILSALLRLKQICNHPDAFLDDGKLTQDRSGKIGLLFSLLEDVLAAGDAAILFTQFPTFGERLVGLIKKTFHEEVLFLHGKTPRAARDEMVQRFAHSAGPRLFLLSLKAGGVGLNLTRASHVFHIDRWWNPAVEDQATDRAYRIGQEKNVAVHLLISAGTLEERIDLMIEEKRALAGSVIGTGEDWITSLSTDELRDVFSLRGELIGGA
jgi:SNF2 family DNA or RNA helicase